MEKIKKIQFETDYGRKCLPRKKAYVQGECTIEKIKKYNLKHTRDKRHTAKMAVCRLNAQKKENQKVQFEMDREK